MSGSTCSTDGWSIRVKTMRRELLGIVHLFSLLFIVSPRRYLVNTNMSIHWLAVFYYEHFDYRRDPFFGLYDIARHPADVVETGEGDCVDFARLAASIVYHMTPRPLALYVAVNISIHHPIRSIRTPFHVMVYDGTYTYSTRGGVTEESLVEYSRRTERTLMVRRRISGEAGPRWVR